MSNTAITFENISKQYRLGLVSTRTLSHDLNRWWQMGVLRKEDPYLRIGETNDRASKGISDYVWALKNINFGINQGDVVGIIGKNGAGKSTLLKILSRVTAPTTGIIKAKGRIASLLEVGTGFHPELTGRENIYMNGSIMGMTKTEITRKLDEIVDFAGIERYLDTPVKRYSSGMTVRLGFSIAAHLEPEILVVDEVLAVGDAEFQKKAIGKMQEVSKGEGRTVLFVSHNMTAVRRLCQTGVLLKDGMIETSGHIDYVINCYLNNAIKTEEKREWTIETAPSSNGVKLLSAKILNQPLNGANYITGDSLIFEFLYYKETEEEYQCDVTIHLSDEYNNLVFVSSTASMEDTDSRYTGKGYYKVTATIPENILNEGNFRISRLLFVRNRGFIDLEVKDILSFEVNRPIMKSFGWSGNKEGIVKPRLTWGYEYNNKKIY